MGNTCYNDGSKEENKEVEEINSKNPNQEEQLANNSSNDNLEYPKSANIILFKIMNPENQLVAEYSSKHAFTFPSQPIASVVSDDPKEEKYSQDLKHKVIV